MPYCYANLTDQELAKVQAYEKETGKTALVVREFDVAVDDLTEEELTRLQALEEELGYLVVVVK